MTSYDFPEMAKVVEGHGIGWLLPRDFNGESIARVISSISGSDLNERAKNCRNFVMRDNWSIHEKRLIALYQEIGAGLVA